jgi:phosphotransferase system  glucose/maltose/N-acetylglucosamine-specific IIC component
MDFVFLASAVGLIAVCALVARFLYRRFDHKTDNERDQLDRQW